MTWLCNIQTWLSPLVCISVIILSVHGQSDGGNSLLFSVCTHGSFSAHPTDCTMYQVCVHGYQLNMTCVYGTGWSQSNSSCVDAALVGCDYQEEKQDSKTFNCPSTFGSFPDSKNCEQYYVCSFGKPTLKKCPENTGWDNKMKLCNHKANLSNCS
ncbi:peritrophin-1-like isoform X1 [Crassostrea virginica]